MIPLEFGSAVVALLVPQRSPFLMVERLTGYHPGPPSSLVACLDIAPDDPVLAGHFPGEPIWPGALTLEGLAQTAGALRGLHAMAQVTDGGWPTLVRALDEFQGGVELPLALRRWGAGGLHLAGAVQARFRQPVRPGQRLDYQVWLERSLGHVSRFRAEATVQGVLVASATMTSARLEGGLGTV